MEKPGKNANIWEHLGYSMTQIYEERKEACIHCKKVWYSIHYRDGVCHSCQELGLPGRSVRQAALRRLGGMVKLIIWGTVIMIVWRWLPF